jgi:hypothetical protein
LKTCKKYGLISSDKKKRKKWKQNSNLAKKSSKIELCALKVLKVAEFLCVYFESLNQGWPIYKETAENFLNYREVSEF